MAHMLDRVRRTRLLAEVESATGEEKDRDASAKRARKEARVDDRKERKRADEPAPGAAASGGNPFVAADPRRAVDPDNGQLAADLASDSDNHGDMASQDEDSQSTAAAAAAAMATAAGGSVSAATPAASLEPNKGSNRRLSWPEVGAIFRAIAAYLKSVPTRYPPPKSAMGLWKQIANNAMIELAEKHPGSRPAPIGPMTAFNCYSNFRVRKKTQPKDPSDQQHHQFAVEVFELIHSSRAAPVQASLSSLVSHGAAAAAGGAPPSALAAAAADEHARDASVPLTSSASSSSSSVAMPPAPLASSSGAVSSSSGVALPPRALRGRSFATLGASLGPDASEDLKKFLDGFWPQAERILEKLVRQATADIISQLRAAEGQAAPSSDSSRIRGARGTAAARDDLDDS